MVMPPPKSVVQRETGQHRPVRSSSEEALVALLRTADVVQRQLANVIEPHGITLQQYNVLRILRGGGADGLPTLAIRDRMIEQAPGITRLLDRLERAGLVRRERSSPDRRQVVCHGTPRGLELLRKLDEPVAAADEAVFAALRPDERRALVRLLGRVGIDGGERAPARR